MLKMTQSDWNSLDNFSRREFLCPCCGIEEMNLDFMTALQALRTRAGFPLIITSGWRCPEYNDKISSTGRTGPHTTGKACDIAVSLHRAAGLLASIPYIHDGMGKPRIDFTGIGIHQSGDHAGRFMHLDMLPINDAMIPRPRIWTYV